MATLPHVRRHDSTSESKEKAPLLVRTLGSSSSSELAALTIASLAVAILSTTFDLFYVETFLSAYELPLSSYALGTLVYTIIDTANDFGGAWFVDAYAMRSSRGAVIGRTGCIFAVCFLTPFFRGGQVKASPVLATAHFILSLSLYDTLFTFSTMLFGSMFTDNHTLSESTRINFMASGKVVNLVGSFVVGRIGLSLFDTDNLSSFRIHVLMLCFISCGLFLLAQRLMQQTTGKDHDKTKATKKLRLWRVVKDLSRHVNFRAWISMEALLECQVAFSATFLKIFVDRLLIETGMSEEGADWLISSIGPASQILGIVCFMPIRRTGYRKIYTWLFQAKIVFSLGLMAFGSPSSTTMVTIFLVVNQIATAAVQTSGFYLAMADMVTEMKYEQAKSGRFDEPSCAGLLFGLNALFCKPVGAILPIVAAWSLARVGFSTGTHTRFFKLHKDPDEVEVRQVLFNLLVIPPLVFSTAQLWFWRRYNLGADRAEEVRLELRRLRTAENSDSNEANP